MKRLVILASLFLCSLAHAETWPLASVKGAFPVSGRHVAVSFEHSTFVGLGDLFRVDAPTATLIYEEPTLGPTQQGQPVIRSTIRTTWQCADGTTQEVTTPCIIFAEPRFCADAHKVTVDAMKILFPPVAPRQ